MFVCMYVTPCSQWEFCELGDAHLREDAFKRDALREEGLTNIIVGRTQEGRTHNYLKETHIRKRDTHRQEGLTHILVGRIQISGTHKHSSGTHIGRRTSDGDSQTFKWDAHREGGLTNILEGHIDNRLKVYASSNFFVSF